MQSYYWIKLYHEILHDPKMGRLSDRLWRRVIECFLMAGEMESDGDLPATADMAWTLRVDAGQLQSELEELAEVGILEVRDGRWFVTHFAERQDAVEPKERMARSRDRKRRQQYYGTDTPEIQECYDTVTTRKGEKSRVEKSREDTDTAPVGAPAVGTPAPPEAAEKAARRARFPTMTDLQNEKRLEVELYFADKSKIPRPEPKSERQRTAIGELWWYPLRKILTLVDWDVGRARGLIDESLEALDGRDLTVSSPKSILNTAISINARNGRGGSGNAGDPVRGRAAKGGGRRTDGWTRDEIAAEIERREQQQQLVT